MLLQADQSIRLKYSHLYKLLQHKRTWHGVFMKIKVFVSKYILKHTHMKFVQMFYCYTNFIDFKFPCNFKDTFQILLSDLKAH